MSGVQYQSECPATPPESLLVKTTSTSDGDVQHVNLDAMTSPRSQTPTGNVLQVQIGPGDIISEIPVVMEFAHHQVHEGETWQYAFYGDVNTTTKDIRISVPVLTATVRTPHMLPEVISDATTAVIAMYEGTTWTAVGTDDSSRIMNRNRNVAGSPSTKIYISGATVLTPNALGTQIEYGYLFSGTKGSINADRNLSEWDLKSNTEYLFRVTTTSASKVLIRLNWYEDLGV